MRQIRSLEDAEIAIRELASYVDYLRSSNIDLNQRRIKNAAPSLDEYDYVVRKELDERINILPVEKQAKGYSVIFVNSGVLSNGDPAGPAYVIQRSCKLTRVTLIALASSSSPSVKLNFRKNFSTLVLADDLEVPADYQAKDIVSTSIFNIATFETNDVLTMKVANAAGLYNVTVQLYFGG